MRFKILTTMIVLLSMTTGTIASAADFADIKGHWAEGVISALTDKGILHGVSDTEFNPDGTVTRAEFIKMALGAAGIEDVPYRSGECLDVTASDWYGGCVQSALDKGLIPEDMIGSFAASVVETDDGTKAHYSGYLNADTPIVREEMAYIAQSVYQYWLDTDTLDTMNGITDLPFADLSSISRWAFAGVQYAYSQDFISGMDDGTFRPDETATRAQAATIITKMLEKME